MAKVVSLSRRYVSTKGMKDTWFARLSPAARQRYIDKHPGSKYAGKTHNKDGWRPEDQDNKIIRSRNAKKRFRDGITTQFTHG